MNITLKNKLGDCLYWIHKLHKILYKQKYIARLSACSTKELSIRLPKFCPHWKRVFRNTVKHFTLEVVLSICGFSIKLLELLENFKFRSFSELVPSTLDLCTTTLHKKLKNRLKEIIHNAFQHKNGSVSYKFIILWYHYDIFG